VFLSVLKLGPLPARVNLPGPACAVDAETGVSAAILMEDSLYVWGSNEYGRLGLGRVDKEFVVPAPHRVVLPDFVGGVVKVSLGSLYTACIAHTQQDCQEQRLLTWGYGGHGNLGHGDRSDRASPTVVEGEPGSAFAAETGFLSVACTRGQEGVKGGLYPKVGGTEGPHTCVIGASGRLYTFGTCHKGVLANLGAKTGGFGEDYDELYPYLVGRRKPKNAAMPRADPNSPFACWPPARYRDEPGPLIDCVSAHIHAAALGADGRLWSWGCGSNDGRCGVERFLNMLGGDRPPKPDMMKCYLMGPHRCGVARPAYWPHGPSLDGIRVTAVATGRNHMACIGEGDGPAAAVVNQNYACTVGVS